MLSPHSSRVTPFPVRTSGDAPGGRVSRTSPVPRRTARNTLPDRTAVAGSECEAERPGEGQACCAVADPGGSKGRDSVAVSVANRCAQQQGSREWNERDAAERAPASRGLSCVISVAVIVSWPASREGTPRTIPSISKVSATLSSILVGRRSQEDVR